MDWLNQYVSVKLPEADILINSEDVCEGQTVGLAEMDGVGQAVRNYRTGLIEDCRSKCPKHCYGLNRNVSAELSETVTPSESDDVREGETV